MAASTLIDHWYDQLRETEELIEHGSPQLRWLRVAYARLYRFLLSAYGVVPAERKAAEALDDSPQAEPTGLTVEPSVDFRGKPARTAAQIGSALKNVHGATEGIEPGPLQQGLHDSDWFIVASVWFENVSELAERLNAASIPCQIGRSNTKALVEVPYGQRAAARHVIAQAPLRDVVTERDELPLGLHDSDWFIVATICFADVSKLIDALNVASIPCRVKYLSKEALVEVPYGERTAARQVVDQVQPREVNSLPAFLCSRRGREAPRD
jgi:hypothetical protein